MHNTHGDIDDREVSIIYYDGLLPDIKSNSGVLAETIPVSKLKEKFKSIIQSNNLSNLFEPIFQRETDCLNITYLRELEKRIIPGHNIDFKDEKNMLLDDIVLFTHQNFNEQIAKQLVEIIKPSEIDINFFKNESIIKHLKKINSIIYKSIIDHTQHEPKQLLLKWQLAYYRIRLSPNLTPYIYCDNSGLIEKILNDQIHQISNIQTRPTISFQELATSIRDNILEGVKKEIAQSNKKQQEEINELQTSANNWINDIKNKLSQLENQTFWERNRSFIIPGLAIMLAAAGLTLIASGIFAPFGIAIIAGTFATLSTILGVTFAGASAILMGMKVGLNEHNYKNDIIHCNHEISQYKTELSDDISCINEEFFDVTQMVNNLIEEITQYPLSLKLQQSKKANEQKHPVDTRYSSQRLFASNIPKDKKTSKHVNSDEKRI